MVLCYSAALPQRNTLCNMSDEFGSLNKQKMKVDFHPLGDFPSTAKEQSKIDLVKMYKMRKRKEEILNTPDEESLALERELVHLRIEIAQLKQDYERMSLITQKTSEENESLRQDLKEYRENEIKYVSKINSLEQARKNRFKSPRLTDATGSTKDSDSDSSYSFRTNDNTRLEMDQIENANLKIHLEQSNTENHRLKKQMIEMERQLNEVKMKMKYVHDSEEVEKKNWFFGRPRPQIKKKSIEDLLWNESSRSLGMKPVSNSAFPAQNRLQSFQEENSY